MVFIIDCIDFGRIIVKLPCAVAISIATPGEEGYDQEAEPFRQDAAQGGILALSPYCKGPSRGVPGALAAR